MEPVLAISDTDEGIVQQVRNGSADAFEQLVRDHQRTVRAFIAGHVASLQTADELAQDVFVAAFRGIDRYQGHGSVAAWLLGIARHKVLTYLRRKTQSKPVSLTAALEIAQLKSVADDPFDTEAEELRLDALRSCIQSLDAAHRDILTRFYYQRESADDIGSRLNKSAGTIRMTLLRIRKSLRNCIASKIDTGGLLR